MGCIFYFSSQEALALPPLFPGSDKLGHTAEYSLLGLLLIRALRKEYPAKSVTMLKFIAFFIAVSYGLSDEFHQGFVSHRTADFLDWCADSFGSALGAFVSFKPPQESGA